MVVRGEDRQGMVHPADLPVHLKRNGNVGKLRRHHMFLVPCYVVFEELSWSLWESKCPGTVGLIGVNEQCQTAFCVLT